MSTENTDTHNNFSSESDDLLDNVPPSQNDESTDASSPNNSSNRPTKPKKSARLADYLHELREENKEYRLKYEETARRAEDSEKKAQQALSNAEKLHTAYEKRIINAELRSAAVEAGMIDMDDIRLADLSKIKLTDEYSVEGAQEVIETLKSKKPHLFKSSNSSLNDPNPPASAMKQNYGEMEDKDFMKKFGLKS